MEPDLYYYAAASIGMLVMQDMPALPNNVDPNEAQQAEFERQLEVLFKSHMGFPAITSFVIYNGMHKPVSAFSQGSSYCNYRGVGSASHRTRNIPCTARGGVGWRTPAHQCCLGVA